MNHSYQQEEKEPYKHLDLRQYIPDNLQSGLTDKDLVLMPTKDLNKLIKSTGKTGEIVDTLRDSTRFSGILPPATSYQDKPVTKTLFS